MRTKPYNKIMVPVDLAHSERLEKAVTTAADVAELYDIPICFVGITAEAPTEVAHTPEEYSKRLEQFGAAQAKARGVRMVETAAYPSHDPAVQLDGMLLKAAAETRSDLIVMASHVPGVPEHLFSSHAGAVAAHAGVSVFVIR